jgi:heme/copper-type cytochrome/quinol oxidase subunit 2
MKTEPEKGLMPGRKWVLWGLVAFLTGLIALAPLPGGSGLPSQTTIQVKASTFAFDPGVIRVNRGDLVTLELVSTDVVHGLYIDGYDLETVSEPGQTSRLSFVADRSGAFRLRCSVTCGGLHPFMVGKLEVGRNDLLWRGVAVSLLAVIVVGLLYRQSQNE